MFMELVPGDTLAALIKSGPFVIPMQADGTPRRR